MRLLFFVYIWYLYRYEHMNPLFITLYEDVTPEKAHRFIHFVNQMIMQYQPSELYFLIASNGGDVDAGFVMYNYLISLHSTVTITMHNIGKIDSIANVIFCAGNVRYAAPSTSFLFHGVGMNFANGAYTRTMIKESLSIIEIMETRISETMCRHSKLSEAELTALFDQGQSRDVIFALEKGLIDDIKVPVVPAGSNHITLNLS